MSAHFELTRSELWPLVAGLASAPDQNQWTVLVSLPERIEDDAREAAEILASLLGGAVEQQRAEGVDEFLKLARELADKPLVLTGPRQLTASEWRALDANRSRLGRQAPALLILTQQAAEQMREHAPNLWSWVGPSAWQIVPEGGLPDAQREERLRALREHFGFADEELVRRAEQGTLPPDPDIAEWLVLIGKGDLLRG